MPGDNRNKWTEHQLELMQQLRAQGARWNHVSQRVGHPVASCQTTMSKFNNAVRAARAQAERKALREAADLANAIEPRPASAPKPNKPAALRTVSHALAKPAQDAGYARSSISTAKLVMDAELRSRIAVMGITGGLLGDPLPGRSALDKKREGIPR